MNTDIILIAVLVLVAVALFLIFWKFWAINQERKTREKFKFTRPESSIKQCPVCNSDLVGKEKIISKVYHTESKTDHLCTIQGCPHCFPKVETGVIRKCPVCGKKIPENGYLIARMFEYSDKKNHVRILGCTECNRKIKIM